MSRIYLVLASLLPTLAFAQGGTPDPSFGVNGVVTMASSFAQYFGDVVVLPDGRITAAGTVDVEPFGTRGAVLRLMENGDPDSTLAGTGIFFCPPEVTSSYGGLAVLPDGRMLLAGDNDDRLSVERRFADGTLDTTFGTGGMGLVSYGASVGFAMDMHVTEGGEIIAGGTKAGFGEHYMATALFSESGVPVDNGTFSFSNQSTVGAAMVVAADGRIILGGSHNALASSSRSIIVRRTGVGPADADTTFNGTGRLILQVLGMPHSRVNDVAVDDQGRILACGWYSPLTSSGAKQGFVLRLLPDGTLDPAFGDNGIATADLPTVSEEFNGLAVLADGNVAVCGTGSFPGFAAQRMVATLFDANGVHGADFGGAGVFAYMAGSFSRGQAVVQQPDGKLVLIGYGDATNLYDLVVIRLDYDGISTGDGTLPDLDRHSRLTVWPNPAKEIGWLQLDLLTPERVYIELFDLAGRSMAVLLNGVALSPGRHILAIPTDHLASGQYMLVCKSGANTTTARLIRY